MTPETSEPRSPVLVPLIQKLVRDETLRLDREQITPWIMGFASGKLRIQNFHGKPISYGGIRFEGSPQVVFWGGYIEPFLEDFTSRTLKQIAQECFENNLDIEIELQTLAQHLKGMYASTFEKMVRADQLMRGKGYPDRIPKRNVVVQVNAMNSYLEQHVAMEIAKYQSRKKTNAARASEEELIKSLVATNAFRQPSIVLGKGKGFEELGSSKGGHSHQVVSAAIRNDTLSFISNCKFFLEAHDKQGQVVPYLLGDGFTIQPTEIKFFQIASCRETDTPEGKAVTQIQLHVPQGGFFNTNSLLPADRKHLVKLRVTSFEGTPVELSCLLYVDETGKLRLEESRDGDDGGEAPNLEAYNGIQLEDVTPPPRDFEGLDQDACIEKIEKWFLENFEDPAQETPIDEGEYVYIWGGPFDAREILAAAFGDALPEDVIEAAAEKLEGRSLLWTTASNRVQPPEDDGALNEDEMIINDPTLAREPVTGKQVAAAVDEVQESLRALRPVVPFGIGHNNPPEPIEEPPLTEDEVVEFEGDLRALRVQAASENPQEFVASERLKKIKVVAEKVGAYIAKKGDLFVTKVVEEAGSSLGKSSGPLLLWLAVSEKLGQLIQFAMSWMHNLH